MAAERGRALPKFGDWDSTNTGNGEGFTVIFNKARDEKKVQKKTRIISPEDLSSPRKKDELQTKNVTYESDHQKKKWLCFMY